MLVQPPSTASGIRTAGSRMSISAMPSTPRMKRAPQNGIQRTLTYACHVAELGSTDHQSPAEITNSTRKYPSAITRTWVASRSGVFPAALGASQPCSSTPAAPTRGRADERRVVRLFHVLLAPEHFRDAVRLPGLGLRHERSRLEAGHREDDARH